MNTKKILIIIASLVAIVAILSIAYVLYIRYFQPKHTSDVAFNPPITFEFPKNVSSLDTTPLSLLPGNYTEFTSKYKINLSKEQLVKLLRYGMVVLPTSYNYLQDNNEIYINNEMLTIYLNSELVSIKQGIIDKTIKPKLLSQVRTIQTIALIKGRASVLNTLKRIHDNDSYTEIISVLNNISTSDKDFILSEFDPKTLNDINYFNLLFDLDTLLNTCTDGQNINTSLSAHLVTDQKINEYEYKTSLGVADFISSNTYTVSDGSNFKSKTINTSKEFLVSSYSLIDYYISQLKEINIESIELNALSNMHKSNDLNKAVIDTDKINIDKGRYNIFTLISVIKVGETPQLTISPLILPVDCSNGECVLNSKYGIEISNSNFNIEYDVKPTKQAAGTVRVPIIMYHLIDKVPANASAMVKSMYLTPREFEKHVAYLTAKNYKTITTEEYVAILNSGKNPKQKTIMLTFDDGTRGQYANAFPILKKYKQVGVFFIPSHKSAITNSQMKEMSDAGMSIGSHSVSHPDFTKLNTSEQRYQIFTSKNELQYTTGRSVNSIAFPGCMWNGTTLNLMSQAGYALGFSCGSSIDNYPKHRYVLSRVHAYVQLSTLKKTLSGIPIF